MKSVVTVFLNTLLLLCLLICLLKLRPYLLGRGDRQIATKSNAKLPPSPSTVLVEEHATSHLAAASSSDDASKLRSLRAHVEKIGKLRLLCWVLTGPATILDRGKAIEETWGRRCNKLLFMTSEKDKSAIDGRISLPGVREGRQGLPMKSQLAWLYVWTNFGQDYEWFYKADDDTYTVVENLKFMLYPHNPAEPYYTGKVLRDDGVTYASGGAGYVLSHAALEKLHGMVSAQGCAGNSSIVHEDQLIAYCLRKAGVKPSDSHDRFGANRFLPLSPDIHLQNGAIGRSNFRWLFSRAVAAKAGQQDRLEGPSCCSTLTISFHYIKPEMQYALDFILYRWHVFGSKLSDTLLL